MAKERQKSLQRLVVVAHRPYRRLLEIAAMMLLVCMLGGLGFYLGFSHGEAESWTLAERLDQAEHELDARAEKIIELERRLAVALVGSRVDREASDQVRHRLAERQAQNAELREEINLYQGVMSPDDSRRGLDIQSLRLYATSDTVRRFKLVLVLQQLAAESATLDVSIDISIAGLRDGKPLTLPLAKLLDPGQGTENRFKFLYYVTVERELTLPADFEPIKVDVKAKTVSGKSQQAESSFDWSL